MKTKLPSDTDKYVSKRLKERRESLGLTQPDLADRLGITFQQFRKYENGINRITAGRLYELARALKTSVMYFFPGGEGVSAAVARGVAEEAAAFDLPADAEAAELLRVFKSIDAAKRKSILTMVRKEAAAAPKRKRKRN